MNLPIAVLTDNYQRCQVWLHETFTIVEANVSHRRFIDKHNQIFYVCYFKEHLYGYEFCKYIVDPNMETLEDVAKSRIR